MENSTSTYNYKREIAASYYLKEKKYWLKKLSGGLIRSTFPYDCQKKYRECKTEVVKFELSRELSQRSIDMSNHSDLRLHMILVAGLVSMLSKYTGNKDVIVGSPALNHGFDAKFINTVLILRNRVLNHMTFKELLMQVKQTISEAIEHVNYPIEILMPQLNPALAGDDFSPFDTAILLENIHDKRYIRHIKLDLIFSFSRKDDRIKGRLEYNSLIYHKESIERIIAHFKNLLSIFLFHVDLKIDDTAILSEEEKRKLLFEFNDTELEYPEDKTIPQIFAEQVERTPGRIALVGSWQSAIDKGGRQGELLQLTYLELNRKSNQFAHLLKQKGVGDDGLVALMVHRSVEMFISILSILKAGGAYLPVDPGYPEERIHYMLKESAVRLLVMDSLGPGFWDTLELDRICICQINGQPQDFSPQPTPPATSLAYVIYTSGSTGKPKGVMIEHAAIHNFIKGLTAAIDFAPGKTILALTTISFDIFVLETLLPLSQGLRVVLADESLQKDLTLLDEFIVKQNLEMIQATPTRMLMFTYNVNGSGTSCLKNLKEIIVGGEPFPEKLLEELQQLTSARIYNVYGPTETTVWSTIKEVTSGKEITIGQPIANTRISITDQNYNLQPVGVIGELNISGDGLARGYLNNPELTAEKFVLAHSPWLIADRETMKPAVKFPMSYEPSAISYIYRTGDLARWLPDGNIKFLGRKDQQVKIRGHRVELEEIEKRLATYAPVKEAVVVLEESDANDKRLVAYVVPDADTAFSVKEWQELEKKEIKPTDGKWSSPGSLLNDIKAYIKEKLPDYMIPSEFVFLHALPLTSNGKVERKALSMHKGIRWKSSTTYVAPKTGTEEILATIWKEVLGLNKISIHDNFFELGGDSFNIAKVNSKMIKAIGKNSSILTLFRYPTISSLAHYLDRGNSKEGVDKVGIDRLAVLNKGKKILKKRIMKRGDHSVHR